MHYHHLAALAQMRAQHYQEEARAARERSQLSGPSLRQRVRAKRRARAAMIAPERDDRGAATSRA